jgi:hypothetical protein
MRPSMLWLQVLPEPWILSCEEAIQLAYRSLVALLRCPLTPEIMHKGAPEVFLTTSKTGKLPYDLYRQCWCNEKSNQKKTKQTKF